VNRTSLASRATTHRGARPIDRPTADAMAQVVDITSLLQAAQSPDANARTQAEAALKQLEAQPSSFLLSLSSHLSNEANPVDTRRLAGARPPPPAALPPAAARALHRSLTTSSSLPAPHHRAGLILKNTLDARDEAKKAALATQWAALAPEVAAQVRAHLLGALGSAAQETRHTAALVVAKVAAVDVPRGAWPELVPALLGGAAEAAPPGAREAALEALGYVCEELGALEEDYLDQSTVNAILTAVVAGARGAGAPPDVRLAATVALNNALEFAESNFSNAGERDYIMQVVCEATLAEGEPVRRAAWECLVRVAELHYGTLPAYMGDIFGLTQRAVRGDAEAVALQALEFWCTVAEEEAERADAAADSDGDEADSSGVPVGGHGFVRAALPQLAPLLLEQLTKQEEGAEAEDGAWNVAMAAGLALALAAQVAGDEVVPLVMPYVQENIQASAAAEDWRRREAATFAFGSILEGPLPMTLASLAATGLPFLLSALRDAHPAVRNTTAWAVGRVLEFVHGAEGAPPLLTPANLPGVAAALLEASRDEPHVAEKACYAISKLAAGFAGAEPSPLAPYFKDLVTALLAVVERPVGAAEAARLQTQAFEAVNEVVRAADAATLPLVAQLLPVAVVKLRGALAGAGGEGGAERASEASGLLCGVVQVAVTRLTAEGEGSQGAALALAHADAVVEALLTALVAPGGSHREDALLAAGAVTYAAGRGFTKYLPAFVPALQAALAAHADWQACEAAVGVLGDVCRAVEADVLPYAEPLVGALLGALQSEAVDRKLKPPMLGALGDVALAAGDGFDCFTPHVAQMLAGAAGMAVAAAAAASDRAAADYVNDLRLGVLQAWTGLLNGLSRPAVDALLAPHVPGAVDFVGAIAADGEHRSEAAWRAAAALLGDVASLVTGAGEVLRARPFVRPFLQHCAGQLPEAAESARWALSMVERAEAA
jgi:importin subunit beta-1